MKKTLCLLMICISGNSAAAFMSGNELYERYQAYARTDNGTATSDDYNSAYDYLGYVTGVWDSLGPTLICPYGKITRGQVSDIVGRGLQNNPQSRSKDANELAAYYLMQSFPCTK